LNAVFAPIVVVCIARLGYDCWCTSPGIYLAVVRQRPFDFKWRQSPGYKMIIRSIVPQNSPLLVVSPRTKSAAAVAKVKPGSVGGRWIGQPSMYKNQLMLPVLVTATWCHSVSAMPFVRVMCLRPTLVRNNPLVLQSKAVAARAITKNKPLPAPA